MTPYPERSVQASSGTPQDLGDLRLRTYALIRTRRALDAPPHLIGRIVQLDRRGCAVRQKVSGRIPAE